MSNNNNIFFKAIVGSHAYGTNTVTSDIDYATVVIPPLEHMFPHAFGKVPGYLTYNINNSVEFIDKTQNNADDITIYPIVKYFNLIAKSNPNVLETIFLPKKCYLESSTGFQYLRKNAKMFITKQIRYTFLAYALSQIDGACKMNRETGEKRKQLFEKYGFDTKMAGHAFRLLYYAADLVNHGQIMFEDSVSLIMTVKGGEVSYDRCKEWFSDKYDRVATLIDNSHLEDRPDEDKIGQLLYECLNRSVPCFEKYVWNERK